MTSEIKQRIEQINNGQVPEGYKETEFGIFPCDWVTDKTFGDLFSFNGGLGKSREELSENGIEYLHYGDMHRSDFNIASLEQYSKLPKYDTKIKGDESFLMQDGDVAFLDASEDLEGTSRSVLIDNPENKPFIAGLHIIYGRPRGKELSKYYKQYLTRPEYIKKQFKKLASGFKVYGLNRNTITGIKCAYPKFTAEQEKIAEILMKWDEAIVLYDRQIEKLKRLKLVCIKKMFPKKRSKVPEVRFKGFTKDWEQRKVQGVADRFDNLRIPVAANLRVHGTTPYYGANGIQDYVEGFTHDGEFVLVAEDGANDLKNYPVKCVNGRIWVNNHAHVLQGKAGIADNSFLAFAISQSDIESLLVGGGRAKLNAETLMSIEFRLPCLQEQYRIGEYLTQLNHLITLHQRKVEKIKTQRKALQQYLLNGIVRVEV